MIIAPIGVRRYDSLRAAVKWRTTRRAFGWIATDTPRVGMFIVKVYSALVNDTLAYIAPAAAIAGSGIACGRLSKLPARSSTALPAALVFTPTSPLPESCRRSLDFL